MPLHLVDLSAPTAAHTIATGARASCRRFRLFPLFPRRFMLMSGCVKVFAHCPTWRELTALEFHFASTCLPTAEAWLFHSLP